MFEHKSQNPISHRLFVGRMARSIIIAVLLMGVSLLGGVCGYHYFNHLLWLDALLDASMILGGMGPVSPITSDAAKYFASFYALYSGLVVVVSMGVLFAPIIHRILHTFHADDEGKA